MPRICREIAEELRGSLPEREVAHIAGRRYSLRDLTSAAVPLKPPQPGKQRGKSESWTGAKMKVARRDFV